MCRPCWGRFKRHGDPKIRKTNPQPEICIVDGCDRKPHARGWCTMHWQRWKANGDPLSVSYQKSDAREIADFLDAIAPQDECLVWPFARNDFGYGIVGPSHGERRVHRLVCRRFHGDAPDGKPLALHRCGNGSGGCVNPDHLYWGDAADNRADAERHGTAHNPPILRGEDQHAARLTEDLVKEIRASNRSDESWAEDLDLHPDTIKKARDGTNWGHVD